MEKEVRCNENTFNRKGHKKSLALFLVLVFIFEIIAQFLPMVKVFAIDFSAVANNYHEGGIDSYKNITRSDVISGIFQNSVPASNKNGYSLNVELAIDYRNAVYGLPIDVPNNEKNIQV